MIMLVLFLSLHYIRKHIMEKCGRPQLPPSDDPKVQAKREKARANAKKKRDGVKETKVKATAGSTIAGAIKRKLAVKYVDDSKAKMSAGSTIAGAIKRKLAPAKPKAQNPLGGKTKAPPKVKALTKKEQKALKEAEDREIEKEKDRLFEEKRARQKEESDWEVYKNIHTKKYRNEKGKVIDEQGDKDTRNQLELMKTNDADGEFMKSVKKYLEVFWKKRFKEMDEENKKRADDLKEWTKQMKIDDDKWKKDLNKALDKDWDDTEDDDKAKITAMYKKLFKQK